MHPVRQITFGVQIGPQPVPYAARRDYWQEAERLGYTWASIGDHFMPVPVFGVGREEPWPEAWTTLTALAMETQRLRVGVLVLAVGYRHPAVLAKMAAALDVITGGRLEIGIGAGYHEPEYRMYGLPFPPPAVRIAQMAEAIQVCKLLWTERRADFSGTYFALRDALCEPKPVQKPHPPVWVGGGGERLTLRVVARYADGWNFFVAPVEHVRHKLDVLRAHCAEIGREFGAIRKQLVGTFIVREDPAQVEAEMARFAAERHLSVEQARAIVVAGTPEEVAAHLVPYIHLGVDMFLVQERVPLDYETLRLIAERVAPRLHEHVASTETGSVEAEARAGLNIVARQRRKAYGKAKEGPQ